MTGLSPDDLKSMLQLDPESGRLYWKPRPLNKFKTKRAWSSWNKRYAGSEAFTAKAGTGYRMGSIFKRMYYAHRVIWAINYGAFPDGYIDHIDGDRENNAINNLRCVNHAENCRNQKLSIKNTSGVVGVRWDAQRGKWSAQIVVNGAPHYIGRFDNFEDAVRARMRKQAAHGFHENHGRS